MMILKKNAKCESEFDGFDWLITNKKRKQHFDYYFRHLKFCGERDGEGHFFPVRFNGISIERAQKIFEDTQYRDALKNQKVAQHPEDVKYFIRFRYDEPITIEHIRKRLIDAGIPIEFIKMD